MSESVARSLATSSGSRRARRNSGQGLEVIRAGTLGREQQENQIDRLVVQCFEIDRRFKTCENTGDLMNAVELAMRNGDAVAHTGGAELFTLEDDVENFPFETPVILAAFAASSWHNCFWNSP